MGHTTNYTDTFIAVAPDTAATAGIPPRETGRVTLPLRMFRLIHPAPHTFTSDDVFFAIHADRLGIPKEERDVARIAFFSKPMACLRAAALSKRYGWGVHHDAHSRIALVGMETEAYARLVSGTVPGVTVVNAMRSRR